MQPSEVPTERQSATVTSVRDCATLVDSDEQNHTAKIPTWGQALSSELPDDQLHGCLQDAPAASQERQLPNKFDIVVSGAIEQQRGDTAPVPATEQVQQQRNSMMALAAALKRVQRRYVEALKFAVQPKSLLVAQCRQVCHVSLDTHAHLDLNA
jgi:hypothetical protein